LKRVVLSVSSLNYVLVSRIISGNSQNVSGNRTPEVMGTKLTGCDRTPQAHLEPRSRLSPDGARQHIRVKSSTSGYWPEKPLPPMPKSWFEEDGGCFSVFGVRGRGEFDIIGGRVEQG
jgi:hypothetical protein